MSSGAVATGLSLAPRLLEAGTVSSPMADRLLAAARRLENQPGAAEDATSALRPEQQPVLASFQRFLTDRIIAGDFEQETLGRLMSTAPFFRAAELFRYSAANRSIPALICCASRQQAHDLRQYLVDHRPASSPVPGLILGETPDDERIGLLSRFERGEIDTLVQVGVLIEGWNSPRCKLLVDLAPSHSRVRATQKFFRVMTRYRDREARIYVLVPTGLPELPILPTDLFGKPFDDYECGTLLATKPSCHGLELLDRTPHSPVAGVRVKKRIIAALRFEKPKLDPTDAIAVRSVVAACPEFDPKRPCGFRRFQTLRIRHGLLDGTGALLLDHLGVRTNEEYRRWINRLFPESAADEMLREVGFVDVAWPCARDLAWLLESAGRPTEGRLDGWLALGGGLAHTEPSAEDLISRCEDIHRVRKLLRRLKPRTRDMVVKRFGLEGHGWHTLREIGEEYEITPWRVSQVIAQGLWRMRREWGRLVVEEEAGGP